MVEHGGSSAGSYLADPTSPIPSHCASIVVTSTLRVKTGNPEGDSGNNIGPCECESCSYRISLLSCILLMSMFLSSCLHVGLNEVKQHESRLSEISGFDKDKLSHAETKEKVVMPDASGK